MMDEHAHKWELYLQWDEINDSDALCPFARCKHKGCDERLRYDEIEARLNKTERLEKKLGALMAAVRYLRECDNPWHSLPPAITNAMAMLSKVYLEIKEADDETE